MSLNLWSATAIWFVAGVWFAGAYMPGLKALTDRLPPGDASRSITLYTSSFSFGVGISFLASQLLAEHFGWRTAFLVSDLDAAVGELARLQIETISEPVAMEMGPGLPTLRFMCFRGPDAEVVELIEQPS